MELFIEKARLSCSANDLPPSFSVLGKFKFGYGHSAHSSPKLYNFAYEKFQHKLQSVGAQALKAPKPFEPAKRRSSSSKGAKTMRAGRPKAKAPWVSRSKWPIWPLSRILQKVSLQTLSLTYFKHLSRISPKSASRHSFWAILDLWARYGQSQPPDAHFELF